MPSAFNLHTGSWNIAWPGRISRHDVVYQSPPMDPMQGMPIGNGDTGALCWCEESRLIIQVNKCDLWDDASFGPFAQSAHGAEEAFTKLKHAGRLIIDFHQPVFDTFYLGDFSGRISLADASITLHASGPLGEVTFTAFLAGEPGVLWMELTADLVDPTPVDVTVEHWGSRAFSRWYWQVNRDAAIGLSGTTACHDSHGAYTVQEVSGGTFAFGCRALVEGEQSCTYHTNHRHAASMTIDGPGAKRCSLLAAVASPAKTPAVPRVSALLDTAVATGCDALWQAHCTEWQAYWLSSLMESGNAYLDNLWHLTMFYLRASQLGAYPGRFINALWGWNRDVQPWNVYFHWNQQTLYWPLNAAGHPEAITSYLEFRFAGLPHAREDARTVFGTEGAFVSDLVERRGYNSTTEQGNHTPVVEIALDFWRQYRYTGDATFLRTRVVPYMIEAALFFQHCFVRGEDGRYHTKEGTALEGWVPFVDTASEITYGHAFFRIVLAALAEAGMDHPAADTWREIAESMTPIPVVEADPQLIARDGEQWTLQRGWFAGTPTPTNTLLAAGYRLDQQRQVISLAPTEPVTEPTPDLREQIRRLETTYQSEQVDMGYVDIFPEIEYLSIFPAGLIGLAEPEAPLAQAARNTLRLYAPGLGGYDRTPIVMARLGMGPETWRVLDAFPERWQFYCNGFGHYNSGMRADQAARFFRNTPVDVADNETHLPMYAAPFRHMGMESISMCACAMNEALLQSYDGVIRFAPAVTPTQSARFTLHAVGGFIVSAEISDGTPAWIAVRSTRGGACTVQLPWPTAVLYRDGAQCDTLHDACVTLPTIAEELLLLVPDAATAEGWQCLSEQPAPNDAAKVYRDGYTQLGLPRMF